MRRQAVALLLPARDGSGFTGKILAISRGLWKPWDLGLPGGKVEPGEDLIDAIIRETREEVGIRIIHPQPVFRRICDGPTDYDTTVFVVDYFVGQARTQGREGWVRWVTPRQLCSGTFGKYNTRMLAHVREKGIIDF